MPADVDEADDAEEEVDEALLPLFLLLRWCDSNGGLWWWWWWRTVEDSVPLSSQPLDPLAGEDKSSMSLVDSDNLSATADSDDHWTLGDVCCWADSLGANGDNCSLLGRCGLLLEAAG